MAGAWLVNSKNTDCRSENIFPSFKTYSNINENIEAHEKNVTYNALVGNQASCDLDEALAACNRLPSVLDNWFLV